MVEWIQQRQTYTDFLSQIWVRLQVYWIVQIQINSVFIIEVSLPGKGLHLSNSSPTVFDTSFPLKIWGLKLKLKVFFFGTWDDSSWTKEHYTVFSVKLQSPFNYNQEYFRSSQSGRICFLIQVETYPMCTQTSVQFVMVRRGGGFCFTGLGHVNIRKAKDGGHSSSPLTAVIHPSFCTQGHCHPGTTPNRMLSATALPSCLLNVTFNQPHYQRVKKKVVSSV